MKNLKTSKENLYKKLDAYVKAVAEYNSQNDTHYDHFFEKMEKARLEVREIIEAIYEKASK